MIGARSGYSSMTKVPMLVVTRTCGMGRGGVGRRVGGERRAAESAAQRDRQGRHGEERNEASARSSCIFHFVCPVLGRVDSSNWTALT